MKIMPMSEFRQLNAITMERVMPIIITADGREIGVVQRLSDAVVISDLHPNMQNKIRAMIQMARSALPPIELIHKASDAKELSKEE